MAKDSLVKASTPKKGLETAPGKSDNWVERTGPGGKGGSLPAYVEHLALAIEKKGKTKSEAIAIAIGTIKRWAAGGGTVDATTRAAAQKALAEWTALKSRSHAKKAITESAVDEYAATDEDLALVESVVETTDPLSLAVELGDLTALLEVPAGAALSARGRSATTPGARKTVAAKPPIRKPTAKTRSGGSGTYDEGKHPRGRGGTWTIKSGSSGEDVRTVQRKIGAKADGHFGEKTKQQVMDFQRKHGLQVDGIVGHQTATALAGHYDAARSAKVGGLKGSDRAKLNLTGHSPVVPRTPKAATVKTNRQPGNPRAGETYVQTTNLKGQKVHRYTKNGKTRDVVIKETALDMIVEVRDSVLDMRIGDDGRLVEADTGEIREESDLALVETIDGHSELLTLVESAVPANAEFNADGTIDMILIRPCHGRGVANAIYESPMLERDAHVFTGWPIYDNHDSETARRARRGLPRPPSELAGEVREAHWDPSFTTPLDAEKGFGQGAVIGRVMLTEDAERLVRRLPNAVKVSINAKATGIKPTIRNGKRGMLVEGILNDPEKSSVDLVTKAGAGGAVASLYREMVAA